MENSVDILLIGVNAIDYTSPDARPQLRLIVTMAMLCKAEGIPLGELNRLIDAIAKKQKEIFHRIKSRDEMKLTRLRRQLLETINTDSWSDGL